MKVEVSGNNVDEFEFGFFAAYGEDENGGFHVFTIGLFLLSISFYKYL